MTVQTQIPLSVEGPGLITGKPCRVTLTLGQPGQGIVFVLPGGERLPATPDAVVNTDRGVTLATPTGKTLSIVEHFLSAAGMAGLPDLDVTVEGAPELPLLDGSALPWWTLLRQLPVPAASSAPVTLTQPVIYEDPENPRISIVAHPAESLSVAYLVDFDHPDLSQRWWQWDANEAPFETAVAPARTFGYVAELPALQARGLALGVTAENTVGLTEDGGYTTPLRLPLEPIRHKVLDFLGDLTLCGIPVSRLQARFIVTWGGHDAHLAFGRQLRRYLRP